MKKERQAIMTLEPLSEMWSKLGAFLSPHYCSQFLKERIENKFYGLDYESLIGIKNEQVRKGLALDDLRLITSRDIRKKVVELSYNVRQAREYYESARNTTELTLPVLLYYGMASLGKMLVDSTFECIHPEKDHGLTPKSIRKVSVMPRGFFTRFHDTYNTDPTIYVRGLSFTMKELFSMIPDLRREYEEVYEEESKLDPSVDEETEMSEHFHLNKGGLELAFPALTSHFLLMFLLSSNARYRPKEWGKMIEGKSSNEIYLIRKFLKVSARRFPNLILNELFGEIYIYHPGARFA